MYEPKKIMWASGLAATISFGAIVLATATPHGALAAQHGKATPAAGEETATSPKIRLYAFAPTRTIASGYER